MRTTELIDQIVETWGPEEAVTILKKLFVRHSDERVWEAESNVLDFYRRELLVLQEENK